MEKTKSEDRALLEQLYRAAETNPRPFGRDVQVAFGVGASESPTWLCLELKAASAGRGVTQSWVAQDVDAALFVSSDDGETLVSGDASLLKAAFQHLLGGQNPLNSRLTAMVSK